MLIARLRSVADGRQVGTVYGHCVWMAAGVVMGARGFCGKRRAWRWQMGVETEALKEKRWAGTGTRDEAG